MAVRRTAAARCCIKLIAQSGGFSEGAFPLRGQQVQQGGLILTCDAGQGPSILADEARHGLSIQLIRLRDFAGMLAALSCPARIDLIAGFACRHQILG